MTQQYEALDTTRPSSREPNVALTETQHADYRHLMFWAESLLAEGKRDEAKRIKSVASKIVQSGAPRRERL